MPKPKPPALLLRVEMSAGRRIFVCGTLALIAAALLNAGVLAPEADLLSRLLFGLTALICVLVSWRVWTATAMALELREDGLWQEGGRCIARLDEIDGVSRGLAVMRPANGFALTLKEPAPHAWVPGLWWRMGRKVGIGGMTPKLQTRMIGEALEAMVMERTLAAQSGTAPPER